MVNAHEAHLTLAASAPMRLTTTVDMSGTERKIPYPVPQRVSGQERGRQVRLGRGPRGDAWAFKLATTAAGGRWSLGSLAVVLGAIKRSR